jgi:hypothetical protein
MKNKIKAGGLAREASGFLLSVHFMLLTGLVFSVQTATAGDIGLLMPAYGNPCCGTGMRMWNSLISTAQDANANNLPLHLNIIFNPASGPGMTTDPNYYPPGNPSVGHQLVNLRNAGGSHITVYGYVATGYGAKPLNDIENEIDRYQTLYPNLVDGIFLDEMSNQLSKVADNHTICVHIKSGTPPSSYKNGPVIGNPGTQTVEDYLLPATQAADTLVNFENTGNDYVANYSAPSWVNNYTPAHFAHLIHTQSAPWDANFLILAVQRNAGMIYVTDDALPNPWDALASYWADEAGAIKTHNSAPVISCVGFDAPFDVPISLKAKVNRAIPLKMQLFANGTPITDLNIGGPAPVVNVKFSAGGGPAIDVTDQLAPWGQSSDGNQFRFDPTSGRWVFNLGTKSFTAPGTYTVTAVPGDTSYAISPTCTGQFVRSN